MNEQLKEDIELVKATLEWFTRRHKGKWSYNRSYDTSYKRLIDETEGKLTLGPGLVDKISFNVEVSTYND